MGRPLRIEYPGAFYHITSRGNERKTVFRTRAHYEKFLTYLNSCSERYGARIHCFCLMPNHYHLLLETPRGNLTAILHHLNTSYTNYFNRKTGRVGHLFQGRYRAILVEKDSYALQLSRYIHLNPLRAELVKNPLEYRWSSYGAYGGRKVLWDWLDRDFILGQMGGEKETGSRRYRKYVEDGMDESTGDPLSMVVASTLLGSQGFIEEVKERWLKKREAKRDVPALKQLSRGPDLEAILRETEKVLGKGSRSSRRVALHLSHELSGKKLGEIGKFYGGLSPSAVTQNTRRVKALLESDERLSGEVEKLRKLLSQ